MKMKVNGIELTLPDDVEVELLDGGDLQITTSSGGRLILAKEINSVPKLEAPATEIHHHHHYVGAPWPWWGTPITITQPWAPALPYCGDFPGPSTICGGGNTTSTFVVDVANMPNFSAGIVGIN